MFLSFRVFFCFILFFVSFKPTNYSCFKFLLLLLFFHHWLQVHLFIIYCFNYSFQPTIVIQPWVLMTRFGAWCFLFQIFSRYFNKRLTYSRARGWICLGNYCLFPPSATLNPSARGKNGEPGKVTCCTRKWTARRLVPPPKKKYMLLSHMMKSVTWSSSWSFISSFSNFVKKGIFLLLSEKPSNIFGRPPPPIFVSKGSNTS